MTGSKVQSPKSKALEGSEVEERGRTWKNVEDDGLTFVEGEYAKFKLSREGFLFLTCGSTVSRHPSGVSRHPSGFQVFLFLTHVGGVRVRGRVQSPKSTVGSRLSGSGVSRPRPAVTWESKSESVDD